MFVLVCRYVATQRRIPVVRPSSAMSSQLRARDEPRIVLGQRYSMTITHVKAKGARSNVSFGPAPIIYAAGDNRITYGLVSLSCRKNKLGAIEKKKENDPRTI